MSRPVAGSRMIAQTAPMVMAGGGIGDRLTPVVERLIGRPARAFMQFARDYVVVFRGRALAPA